MKAIADDVLAWVSTHCAGPADLDVARPNAVHSFLECRLRGILEGRHGDAVSLFSSGELRRRRRRELRHWYSYITTLRKHRAGRGRRHITCILFKPQLCAGPATGAKELLVDLADRCETEGY